MAKRQSRTDTARLLDQQYEVKLYNTLLGETLGNRRKYTTQYI